MKNFAVLLIGLFLFSCATTPPGKIIGPYQKVLDVSGTKDEVFIKTMKWMTKTFQSAKAVIEYQDKEAGIVTGNGRLDMHNPVEQVYLDFVLTVEIKEGKVRLSFENLASEMTGGGRTSTEPVREGPGVQEEIKKRFAPLIDSYIKEMSINSDF